MSWQYEGSNGVVRCDHPGCTAHVTEGSLSGACWSAEIDRGWLLVGDAGNGHALCPEHRPAPEGEPTATPWLTGPEQGGSELLPMPTPKQQDDAYDKWGSPWLCDYED